MATVTDEWEPKILDALGGWSTFKCLSALRELFWRREILLQPISVDLEAAACRVMESIDWSLDPGKTIEGQQNNAVEFRMAWRSVALALLTDARLDWDRSKFDRRLSEYLSILQEDPEANHRVIHERSLWAVYSGDFDSVDGLLDEWNVDGADPAWQLRKAALLFESCRGSEALALAQLACDATRSIGVEAKTIATASREAWALAATLNSRNQQETRRELDKLAAYKCDVLAEKELASRALVNETGHDSAPTFDPVIGNVLNISWSQAGRAQYFAAFRAIRMTEIAGLPLICISKEGDGWPISLSIGMLKASAEALLPMHPEFAARMILRVCTSPTDKSFNRVLSRAQIGAFPEKTVQTLLNVALALISQSLPRLDGSRPGIGKHSWADRCLISLEALSRLVLRAPDSVMGEALDIWMKCYQEEKLTRHLATTAPLNNLLNRTWAALPANVRRDRALELLTVPISDTKGFEGQLNRVDPGTVISASDLNPVSEKGVGEIDHQAMTVISKALRGDREASERAILRALLLIRSGRISDVELAKLTEILWGDADPILESSGGANAPWDWVYLVLPEPRKGAAELSFRKKWLDRHGANELKGMVGISGGLAQVGAAIAGLREADRQLAISQEEELRLSHDIVRLVEMFAGDSISLDLGIGSRIEHIGYLASAITIRPDDAIALIDLIGSLRRDRSDQVHPLLAPVIQVRDSLSFMLTPGLVNAAPGRRDELIDGLITGITSLDEALVSASLGAIHTWLSAAQSNEFPPVPNELIRELGAIVAGASTGALADVLYCASQVIELGTPQNSEAMKPLVLRGLSQLSPRLKYGKNDFKNDVHVLRLLCTRIANQLADEGLESDETVITWLDIGRNDPFPEVRREIETERFN